MYEKNSDQLNSNASSPPQQSRLARDFASPNQPPNQPPARKRFSPELLTRFLLVLISIFVAIFLLELAVRLLPPPYQPGEGHVTLFHEQTNLFTCDQELGWVGRPNFQGTIDLSESQVDLTFNSLGMHDTEHTPEKAPHTFRILMLGDSFVQAVQVGETATAHQVLEDQLNLRGPASQLHFEVISSGVINWGTNHQLIYYRQQGRHFQPDLVLLMFHIGNDFFDNLPGKALTIDGFNCYAPYFTLCDDRLNPDPLKYAPGVSNRQNNCSPIRRWLLNITGTLYQNSRLYQQLEPLIISSYLPELSRVTYPHYFWTLYMPGDKAELEQAWQITQAAIVQLQQEVEADGAQFAVVFFPHEVVIRLSSLSPVEQEALLRENPDFAGIELDRPNQRLAEFLDRQNIPYLDLTPSLVEGQASQEIPLHFPGDGHWTVAGNRFVADTLAQWLAQNNLLSEP